MEIELKSFTPAEQATFRLRALYEQAGYRKYRASRFEEYALYQEYQRFLPDAQVITFTDLDGKLRAIKPDVTLSIAKTAQPAAGECKRFYYNEEVCRPSRESHTFQTIHQMGLESMGAVDADEQAAVVRLALQSLAALDVPTVLEISHMGYLTGLLDALHVPAEARAKLLDFLRAKNAHELRTAALAAGLAATSLMGGYLVYYGLVLAVFAPLGLVPLVRLAEKTPAPVRTALPWAVLAACAAACYALTPNRALRGRARADLPQYRFAAQINGGSLLNYGTLDGGFYTAAGVLPPCKYFCVTNMPLDDQWTDQQAVLKAGAVDYVVALTGDLHGDFPQYAVIDRCSYDGGEGEVTWYLYQLQR